MGASVNASDVQKNFGVWHDKALQEPVRITKYGRETVYLISADTFHELWRSYQQAKSTAELTDEEMEQIRAARTPAEHDYDYEEDPEPTAAPGIGR
jgi:antitoxin StbD